MKDVRAGLWSVVGTIEHLFAHVSHKSVGGNESSNQRF